MKIVEIEFTPAGSRILTFTRNENNELVKQRYMQDHYFYVEDPDGDSTTLFGEKVKKRKVKKFWETKAVVKNTDKRTFLKYSESSSVKLRKAYRLIHHQKMNR